MYNVFEIEQIKLDISLSEHRMNSIKITLQGLQKDLDILIQIEQQLIDNLYHLKQSKVVALAFEYKKAKDDLAKARHKIKYISTELLYNEKLLSNSASYLNKLKEKYEEILRGPTRKVITAEFGKKDNG